MRLLYILRGLVPPNQDTLYDKFTYLSEITEGDVLLPVWWKSLDEVPPFLQATFPIYRVGKFDYHLFLTNRFPNPLHGIARVLFYLKYGLKLHRQKKIDVIVTYGTNTPGLAGVILKFLTGAKLIVEIPGVPENAYRYDNRNPGFHSIIKRFLADRMLFLVGMTADCIRLLYPTQLGKYPSLRRKNVAVFHEFVPVHVVAPGRGTESQAEPFVLLVGSPWYTKGTDVLIQAFRRVAAKYPQYRLKLLGYCPDRGYLNELVADCTQIEFLPAMPHEFTLKVISACAIYVSASRTEGMSRVLFEAMAARKPIIATGVGGIPHYLVDDDNALLFESENIEELAAKLSMLMSDPRLRARLASRGFQKVFAEYDERTYAREFGKMLQSVMDAESKSGPSTYQSPEKNAKLESERESPARLGGCSYFGTQKQ